MFQFLIKTNIVNLSLPYISERPRIVKKQITKILRKKEISKFDWNKAFENLSINAKFNS